MLNYKSYNDKMSHGMMHPMTDVVHPGPKTVLFMWCILCY